MTTSIAGENVKWCGDCGKELPFSDFSQGDSKYGLRWACKKCRSSGFTRRQLEQKIERFPHLYIDCDHCDHINSRFVGNGSIYKQKQKRTHCKRCGQELGEQDD